MYWLLSRYYDPEVGRFINADGVLALGSDVLGCNMYAYCGNNPSSYCDPSGYYRQQNPNNDMISFGNGSGSIGSLAVAIVAITVTQSIIQSPKPQAVALEFQSTKPFSVARLFSKTIATEILEKTPTVHHIVPHGHFAARNSLTSERLAAVQDVLNDVGIGLESPFNLMIVSARYHSTMHTNAYIDQLYRWIMPAAGNKWKVLEMLFLLRLDIAAKDRFATGY